MHLGVPPVRELLDGEALDAAEARSAVVDLT
jgi:hypothetical protein